MSHELHKADQVIELPVYLRRKRLIAQAAISWERLWVALWPPLGVAGLFALSALFGLWRDLPFWLHIAALTVFAALLIASLLPLRRLAWPDRMEALRRLERASKLKHRPLSSLGDTLSLGLDEGATTRLWRAHKQALKKSAHGLKAGWPSPGLARRDPFALRGALVLMLFIGFAYAGPQSLQRFMQALVPAAPEHTQNITLDAWLKPPAYTSLAPLFLAQGVVEKTIPPMREFKVPAGSELVVRISGTNKAGFITGKTRDDGPEFIRKDGQIWESTHSLQQSGNITISASGKNIARWNFILEPDTPPVIRLLKKPAATVNQVLKFSYIAKDDYGVKFAMANFRLKSTPPGIDAQNYFIKPPDFALPVPSGRESENPQFLYRNLTAHPWAGLEVILTLTARDEAGQTGASKPASFTLPERVFSKPLARAIIEQRRTLVRDPENRWIVGTAIDALAMAPEYFIKDTGIYLGMRILYRQLHRADNEIDFAEIINLMWDIALKIEDGDLSFTARKLRQAQEELRSALARGASDSKIERLMQNLKKALGDHLRAMRKQAAGQREVNPDSGRRDGNSIRPQDLADMLKEIERLSKSGARGEARKLLAKLQNLLENLKAGPGRHENREDQAMNKWMENFDNLMREQQKLQEETFARRKQQSTGKTSGEQTTERRQETAPQNRQNDKNNEKSPSSTGKSDKATRQRELAGRQKALRKALRGLSRDLGKMGMKAPNPFGRAGEAMRRAEEQLGRGRNGNAAGEQGKALDNLRSAMHSIARQMMRRMARSAGGGPRGTSRPDPLGRNPPTRNMNTNAKMRRSGPSGAEDAYEIRQELKRRLGERTRPKPERQYLQRLLRWF